MISIDHTIIARDALLAQAEAVKSLASRIDAEFQQAVEMILECRGRVVIGGIGKSGIIARKFAATLASTGTPSFYLHPGEAFHGDLGMIMPGDMAILISYRGETEETIKLIPILKGFGCPIIAITGYGQSTLGRHANCFLDISVEREVCPNNLAPTTSTLATMAMGDALAVALIKARNFMPADFARYHPGGSLGKRLLAKVRDVMHTDVPRVAPETSFHDCLFSMSAGRMGLTVVMDGDQLVGIITDGDLRRALLNDSEIIGKPASALMTQVPRTVGENARLLEAEQLMIESKIRALVVTKEETGEVCGVLEIFD